METISRPPGARRPTLQASAGRRAGLMAVAAVCAGSPALGQPMTERSPNLEGTWTTPPHTLHFQFSHRFEMAGSEVDVSDLFTEDGKVVNYPTFSISYGLLEGAHLGVRYSSNATLVGQANEWEPYARVTPVRGLAGGRLSAGALAGWNGAAESLDGEIAVQGDFGRLRMIAAGRAFSSPFDRPAEQDDTEVALAGGAVLALNRFVSLTGDYANMITQDDAQIAWSAGAAIRIPATPHTLAIFATNVTSGTLQGRSVGIDDTTYWGFEFTIPFTGPRWRQVFDPPAARPARPPAPSADPDPPVAEAAAPTGEVVEIEISSIAFQTEELEIAPGTTVRWVNRDPIAHTATSRDGVWDSGLLDPEASFERTFGESGRFEYFCQPHPFMEGVIVVRDAPTPTADSTTVGEEG